jgi:hypothetical protein
VRLRVVGGDDPDEPEEPGRGWMPATIAVRVLDDLRPVAAVAAGGRPVLVVLPADRALRRRIVDVLSGCSIGVCGSLHKVAANTFLLCPSGVDVPPDVRRHLRELGEDDDGVLPPGPIEPFDEELLRLAAAAGDADAHRRLVDAHAELAAVVAGILRPASTSLPTALRVAQEELERAIAADSRRPLLVALVVGIADSLGR